MASLRRLPGLRFEIQAAPVAEPLPRMDIPVFAGFSASGPINVPVAVEDIARFNDLFGEDIVLARPQGSGPPVRGHLASAVRAFFRNGGKRCWVLRLARGAVANRFALPGLFTLGADDSPAQTYALARSEGSWSDGLGISTLLTTEVVPAISVSLSPFEILVEQSSVSGLGAGDVLRVTLSPDGQSVLWVEVADVQTMPPGTTTGGGPVTSVVAGRTHLVLPSPPSSPPAGPALVEKVAFEVWVRDENNQVTKLTGLGCSPLHPRYWAALVNDQTLFETPPPGQEDDVVHADLLLDAQSPRFALCAAEASGALYLPLQMTVLASPAALAEPVAGTPAVRNGLANFDSNLFLEPTLRETSVRDMIAEADYQRYQAGPPGSPPRMLQGIHAALYADEASILSVPDAVQRGWDDIGAPPLLSPPPSAPPARPGWWAFLDCSTPQVIPLVQNPPGYGFIACSDLKKVDAPVLTSTTPTEDGTFQLQWTPSVAGATDVLEEASRPDFIGAEELTRGSGASYTVIGKPPGDYYYRVYRIIGTSRSDYSNGLGWRIGTGSFSLERPAATYDDRVLLDVHRSMLRISAARGDMFALLTLPGHYREQQALAHGATLLSPFGRFGDVPPLDADEEPAFSFVGVYHPWFTGREENTLDELRTTPPDGGVAGIMAKRTLTRGAWIAAANEAFRGIVALDPPISGDFYQAFLDAQINLIRQQPEGFLCLSSDTLSQDPDYRPVNVRRLLSLLRRLALKAGADYVFEPHSDEFRRLVQRGFESVLETLFRNGAFAGATAETSFQVVTDSSLNPPASVDQGRFLAEIRVAPSLPLSFLTVRLLQTADRTYVTEGG